MASLKMSNVYPEHLKNKFGKLSLVNPIHLLSESDKKALWKCDCGKEKFILIKNVLSGKSSSCGQCNLITAAEIATKKFGKLRIKTPQDILPGSNKKVEWICDCGKEKLIIVTKVLSAHTTSCGLCNLITADQIAIRKFGKLQIKYPQSVFPNSHKKIKWVCDCGREKSIVIESVIRGYVTSCNMCNTISGDTLKFGKLYLTNSKNLYPGSNKKELWTCCCGIKKKINISDVTSGKVLSCGKCFENTLIWYHSNVKILKSLKCPITPNIFPPGGAKPLENILRTNLPFKAICPACQNIYYPMFSHIKMGRSITCGCCSYRVSLPCTEITEYIRSLGLEVTNEYKVNKLSYDIFVPAKNLLIEYQGSKWHSSEKIKERDLRKKQNAIQMGYQFMEILEKDWNTKKQNIKKDEILTKLKGL
jgi:hypothetical protein